MLDHVHDLYGNEADYNDAGDFDWDYHGWYRHLAGAYDKKDSGLRMDYSVLSVAVMTLGLIMVVEVFIHRLDHAAAGRPYFTAVLENIYSELAILGMVEFAVFLMQEYYEEYSKEKKDVFGAVHFALFYTALLNAFQSIILAFAVGRVSRRMWVSTEALELNHYVEIREEFDRVTTELGRLQTGVQKSSNSSTSGSDDDKDARWGVAHELTGMKGLWRAIVDRIRYPRLKSRYNELLIQVRFHELRVHFLKAYNLPLKLKIADYLLRSQQSVLIKLVHVSSTAWLLLTASINLLYFLLGIVGYKTGRPGLVGTTLIYVFFCCLFIFIVLALLLRRKVRNIFKQVMHRRELWEVQEDSEEKERLAGKQKSLFWGSSPKLIIAAIQFMQFGYAVALATVIMFWKEISEGGVGMVWYWIAIIVCYGLFVAVAAQVIPQYTLCTSLGQLVDKKRLSESVAVFNLDEAKRQRHEELLLRETMREMILAPEPVPLLAPQLDAGMSKKHGSGGDLTSYSTPSDSAHSDPSGGGLSIADLVSVNTDSLRTNLPDSERDALANRLANRRDRRKRMKAVSDGVALMASLGTTTTAPVRNFAMPAVLQTKKAPTHTRARDDTSLEEQKEEIGSQDTPQEPLNAADTSRNHLIERKRSRRGRMKTLSDGVALMAALPNDELAAAAAPPRLSMVRENSERIADLVFADTKSLRQSLAKDELENLSERDIRRNRKKSNSDGVSDMGEMHRKKSNSDGVAEMRNDSTQQSEKIATTSRRARRQKAVSDGVKAMASIHLGRFFGPESTPDVPDNAPHPTGMTDKLDKNVEHSEKDLDNASMRSLASDDDHSDFDDVPEADPNMMKLMTVEVDHHESPKEKWRNYYLSKRYPVTSNVFGTMIAFFIVGSRIERFLHTEHIVSDEWISFDFGEKITFWTFTGFLALFLFNDVGVFVSLGPYHMQHALRARKVWVATVFDVVLCSSILALFYWAEHERCCYPPEVEDFRYLAEYEESDSYGGDESKYATEQGPAPCDCPTFGSRLHGGLGKIEPYTSLVALRLFRFWVAARIVKYLDTKRGISITKAEAKQIEADNENLDPFDTTDNHEKNHSGHDGHGEHGKHDDHGHGHHGEERGTIAELWEAAVANHPEIVAKYGEFSGELLQAMLGIPILEPLVSPGGMLVQGGTAPAATHKETYLIEDQYTSLPSGAQEIIMAGKLGKAVVSVPDNRQMESTFTIPEHDHGDEAAGEKRILRFEVAVETIAPELDPSLSVFDAPNARLVRSMRRCERKLLPILDTWNVVDVVMTRFEIIYFDAVGIDDTYSNTSVFEALAATKGGKGLRLCDVAAGRRVVGHLSLSEITSINVEREMPSDAPPEEDCFAEQENVQKTEFWKPKCEGISFNRREFWHKIKQDRLVAHTAHDHTLYLRFFSDLEDAQNHPEHYTADNEEEGDLYKNNAFQWVQSVSRMCGPEQLKQALPHFGAQNDQEEIRDFLVVHHHDIETKGHRRGLSRGFASAGGLDILALHHAASHRKGPSRRSSSFGESLVGSLGSSSHHRRFVSTDMNKSFRNSRVKKNFGRSSSLGLDIDMPSSPNDPDSVHPLKRENDKKPDGNDIV